MRIIESLAAKSKLITTNENIKIDLIFINKDYNDIEQELYEKHSLRNWILDIFIN